MSVATIAPKATPAAPKAAPKGRTVTDADKAQLARDEAATVATIRAQWAASTITEAKADTVWQAAKVGVENVRVERSRIVYRAAMVSPVKGEPNWTRAAIILMSETYGDPKSDAKAKNAKQSIAGYLKAGTALKAAELDERTTTPDDTERDIVAKAFKAHNNLEAKAAAAKAKEAKEAAAAAKAKNETAPGDTDGGESKADTDALTFAAVLAQLAKAHSTADMLIKAGGIITESDMETLTTVMEALTVKLAVQVG